MEPDKSRIRASSVDLVELFFPGFDEKSALLELGSAAVRRASIAPMEAIAGVLEQKGYPAEGKEMRDRVATLKRKLEITGQVNDLLLQADAQGKARNLEASLTTLQKAESLGIGGADQASRAGYVLLNLGRFAEAEKMFDRAVSEPASSVYYQSLAARGSARYRMGRRAEGISDIQAAKALDPKAPLAYLLFGLALFDSGEREAAFAEFREGLAVAPEDERIQGALEYLTSHPGPSEPEPRPGGN
jgi:tetratricopeptide (TPR) repeat protein